jgi:hypothetical protein
MRRDPGDAIGSEQDAEQDTELLAAYVDGVAELDPDERHRVAARLAQDPEARADQAAVHTLLDQLRALPPEGAEPDWTAMERSIRAAVGPVVPRPWWRRWKMLAPAAMLATAAAVVLVMWARPAPAPVAARGDRLTGPTTTDDPRPTDEVVALWLDGAEVDVELSASDLLGDDGDGEDDPTPADAGTEPGLLPSTDLAWVDGLDEDAIDRAERWLAGEKG